MAFNGGSAQGAMPGGKALPSQNPFTNPFAGFQTQQAHLPTGSFGQPSQETSQPAVSVGPFSSAFGQPFTNGSKLLPDASASHPVTVSPFSAFGKPSIMASGMQPSNGSTQQQSKLTSFSKPSIPIPATSIFGAPSVPKTVPASSGIPNPFANNSVPKTVPACSSIPNPFANKFLPASTPFTSANSKPAAPIFNATAPAPGPVLENPFAPVNASKKANNDTSSHPPEVSTQPSPPTTHTFEHGQTEENAEPFAKKILTQLRKDKVTPPQWPSNPGAVTSRGPMESFRETYQKYRQRIQTSLIKADLFDDPEKKRKLSDALEFKGICEEMCPEFEKIRRIVEHDVQRFEKEDGVPSPSRMIKTMTRSAAGQDAPLPMDIRSIRALQRTLVYLIDDLLQDDGNLPSMHHFLWNRTRAIRRDFVFHSTMTADEMAIQVNVFEDITRFHVIALHLMSKKGFAAEGFSQQQELEQLGKSLLSLTQAYDDCRSRGIQCENEAEFRAYFILFNANDPNVHQHLQENSALWFDSDEIQTAVSLVQAMQNVWNGRGPLRPHIPTTTALSTFTTYFSIVEDPKVSYTMACFAEIHFPYIRQTLLKTINRAYARIKDTPKDLTLDAINSILRFDTSEEAAEFIAAHDMEFSSDGADKPYLLVNRKTHIKIASLHHSHSARLVERKRNGLPLPQVIHNTVFEEEKADVTPREESPDSMFVSQEPLAYDKEISSKLSASKPSASKPSATKPATFTVSAAEPAQPIPLAMPVNGLAMSNAKVQPLPSNASEKHVLLTPSPTPTLEKPQTTKSKAQTLEAEKPSSVFSKPGQKAGSLQAQPLSKRKDLPGDSREEHPNEPSAGSPPKEDVDHRNGPAQPPPLFTLPSGPKVSDSTPILQTSTPKVTFSTPTPQPASSAVASPSKVGTSQVSSAQASIDRSTPANKTTPKTVSFTSSTPIPPQSIAAVQPPAAPVNPPAPAEADLMGDFTKWIVLGDNGLMEHFQEYLVEGLVRDVFESFKKEEEARKKKEDDDQSWADAMKFRRYNLGLKFFYRWQEKARQSATSKRARASREAMRAYREAKLAEEKEAKQKAAKRKADEEEAVDFRKTVDGRRAIAAEFRERAAHGAQVRLEQSRRRSAEEALRATGIFAGVRNEDDAVARIVDRDLATSLISRPTSSQSVPVPRAPPSKVVKAKKKNVLVESFLKLKASGMENSKRARMYLKQIGLQNGTSNSSRPSTSSSTTARTDFSQSVPAEFRRSTNFDNSGWRRTSRESGREKAHGNVRGKDYWILRSKGLVVMPNGKALHESLAIPMINGARFPGIGDYGLGPVEMAGNVASVREPGLNKIRRTAIQSSHLNQDRATTQSTPVSISPPGKRKRAADDTGEENDARTNGESSSSAKKPRASVDMDETEKILREMREVATQMDESKDWYREQTELLERGISPWGP